MSRVSSASLRRERTGSEHARRRPAISQAQVQALRRVALAVAHRAGRTCSRTSCVSWRTAFRRPWFSWRCIADDSRSTHAHPGGLPARPDAAQFHLRAGRLALRRGARALLSVRRVGPSHAASCRFGVREGAHGFLRCLSAQRQRGRVAGAAGGHGSRADRRRRLRPCRSDARDRRRKGGRGNRARAHRRGPARGGARGLRFAHRDRLRGTRAPPGHDPARRSGRHFTLRISEAGFAAHVGHVLRRGGPAGHQLRARRDAL